MTTLRLVLLCHLCICMGFTPAATAEDAVQEYFRTEKPIWYDSKADSWQRARGREPEASSATDMNLDDSHGPSAFSDFIIFLLYTVIILLIAYLIYVFVTNFYQKSPEVRERLPAADNIKRIQVTDLPFQTEADIENPRLALDQAMHDKQWSKAVIYALILLLTEFHKKQLIQLRPGKTNRNYLQELKRAPKELRTSLDTSIQLFERSFFGHIDIKAEDAQQLYKQVRKTCDHLHREASLA